MKRHSVLGSIGHTTGLAVAVAVLSLWGTSAQALGPNLVQNPSFENNTGTQFQGPGFFFNQPSQTAANFPNWTVTPTTQSIAGIGDNNLSGVGGNTWISLVTHPTPITNSGQYYFIADGDYTSGVDAMISQVISGLMPSATYQLSFDWAVGQCSVVFYPCGSSLTYNSGWDIGFGLSTDSVNSLAIPTQSFFGWNTYINTFTATATSQTLSFLSKGGPSGVPPLSLLDNVSLKMADVPGPLGILGVATAFGYSRRLRRRIGRD